MICPQTKAECKSPVGCGAMGCSILEDNPPPKPTMAEIERLVDVLGNAAAEEASWTMAIHKAAKYLAARAALMAAIRLHGESEYQRGYEVCDACWQVDA